MIAANTLQLNNGTIKVGTTDAVLRSGGRRALRMTAQGPQYAKASKAGVPQFVQSPAARRSAYLRRSFARRLSWQGVQILPPSTAGGLPQRRHSPASRHAFLRRLLLARPARRLVSALAPP